MKMSCYQDLIDLYENPMEHACDMKPGQIFISNGWEKPPACVTAHGKACPHL